jgi:membrane protein implicated in regulation of membrane protease activity
MSILFQIFQGALGAMVTIWVGLLAIDAGWQAVPILAYLFAIGAASYGLLWLLHRKYVGQVRPIPDDQHPKSTRFLPLKVGTGICLFALIVAVGAYE